MLIKYCYTIRAGCCVRSYDLSRQYHIYWLECSTWSHHASYSVSTTHSCTQDPSYTCRVCSQVDHNVNIHSTVVYSAHGLNTLHE